MPKTLRLHYILHTIYYILYTLTTMSQIKIYNTASGKKEVFQPLKDDYVRVYDCGPTVYDYAHIGNFWRYLISDFVRRTLEYNNYKVKQVMNITDVGHLTDDDLAADTGEDKIEKAAKKAEKTPGQIADFYTAAFLKDLRRLNIQQPTHMPKATEHIGQMIDLIKKLEEKGYTYRAGDYLCFDIGKFSSYCKLSKKNLQDLQAGERLEPIDEKKNPFDFALWVNDEEHLQKWDSPWGAGYPGWHIECSAMSMEYLGEQIDIHSGGEDNIFPHHENEIAQSEAATGKQFVKYWLHVRHNLVEGEKMSKSAGNMVTVQNIIDRGYKPLSYRYLCLTVHYRSHFNFTWDSLKAGEKAYNRLKRFTSELQKEAEGKAGGITPQLAEYKDNFTSYINNDFNTPQAIAVLWDLIKSYRSGDLQSTPENILSLISNYDRVLGLKLLEKEEKKEINKEIDPLIEKREKARRQGDYQQADEIRRQIEEQGYRLEDTPQGPRIV